MASLGQNVGENPQHVSCNNKNTEFEEGRQNIMGFSYMKAVYEYTRYLHTEKYNYCTRHSGVSLTRNPVSQQTNSKKN